MQKTLNKNLIQLTHDVIVENIQKGSFEFNSSIDAVRFLHNGDYVVVRSEKFIGNISDSLSHFEERESAFQNTYDKLATKFFYSGKSEDLQKFNDLQKPNKKEFLERLLLRCIQEDEKAFVSAFEKIQH